MQIVTGTRREITIRQWEEQLEKYVKRLNDSMECFRRFHGDSDAEHIMEDAENWWRLHGIQKTQSTRWILWVSTDSFSHCPSAMVGGQSRELSRKFEKWRNSKHG